MKNWLLKNWVIVFVVAVVVVLFAVYMWKNQCESYGDVVDNWVCRQMCPDRNGNGRGHFSVAQQWANCYACEYKRARGKYAIDNGGIGYNTTDFTGCGWFMPPDVRPADVTPEEFSQAWANYWACRDLPETASWLTSASEGKVGSHETCTGGVCKTNNLDFSQGWPFQSRWLNAQNQRNWPGTNYDSILVEQMLRHPDQRLWLLAVRNPDRLATLIEQQNYKFPDLGKLLY